MPDSRDSSSNDLKAIGYLKEINKYAGIVLNSVVNIPGGDVTRDMGKAANRNLGLVLKILDAPDKAAKLTESRVENGWLPVVADRTQLIAVGGGLVLDVLKPVASLGIRAATYVGDTKALEVLNKVNSAFGKIGTGLSALAVAADSVRLVNAVINRDPVKGFEAYTSVGGGLMSLAGGAAFWPAIAGGYFAMAGKAVSDIARIDNELRITRETGAFKAIAQYGDSVVQLSGLVVGYIVLCTEAQLANERPLASFYANSMQATEVALYYKLGEMHLAVRRVKGLNHESWATGTGIDVQWFNLQRDNRTRNSYFIGSQHSIQAFLYKTAEVMSSRSVQVGAQSPKVAQAELAQVKRRWTIRETYANAIEISG